MEESISKRRSNRKAGGRRQDQPIRELSRAHKEVWICNMLTEMAAKRLSITFRSTTPQTDFDPA